MHYKYNYRKYLRDGTTLYLSVILYSISQVLLFAVILLDIILSSWSLSSLLFCKIRATCEIFVLVVTAYSILVMTGVRFIFIQVSDNLTVSSQQYRNKE